MKSKNNGRFLFCFRTNKNKQKKEIYRNSQKKKTNKKNFLLIPRLPCPHKPINLIITHYYYHVVNS
ncbi:Uncharacterized protein APZ42_005423 [Daphnia magna]|uniref:Uncharacterized protein n=1 Tax=Daphnia magna TaxID=35525 RepID=A0A164GGB4_9CRUS|nr:Uncharacterized protein APZ42_005423 [Daphnia magna]